jgi:hypothetical protein
MTKVSKNDSWAKPNEDKFDFTQHARALDAQNQFAPLDTPPGIGLRQFIDRETRLQAASSGSNRTLVPGKIFLRELRDGTYELLIYRGRCTYDAYPGATSEELLEFARQFVEQPTW